MSVPSICCGPGYASPADAMLRVLHDQGDNMIPVNPKEAGNESRGLKATGSLAETEEPVDMVQVFRKSEALPSIAQESIDIGAKVLWGQIGVYYEQAARLAVDAGLGVVVDRCPKIELFRPFWKPKLNRGI